MNLKRVAMVALLGIASSIMSATKIEAQVSKQPHAEFMPPYNLTNPQPGPKPPAPPPSQPWYCYIWGIYCYYGPQPAPLEPPILTPTPCPPNDPNGCGIFDGGMEAVPLDDCDADGCPVND